MTAPVGIDSGPTGGVDVRLPLFVGVCVCEDSVEGKSCPSGVVSGVDGAAGKVVGFVTEGLRRWRCR